MCYSDLSKIWHPNYVTLMGKTGTAQIASPNGGYLTGTVNYIRSFAGIFPYENPEYIFYVSAKQIDGGASAVAKVVTKAIESIANYANITNKESELDLSKVILLNSYISGDVILTKEELEKLKLQAIIVGNGKIVINQYPLKKTNVLVGSKVFLLTEGSEYLMPDISGWSSSEVMNFCNIIGLKYEFTGFGRVTQFNIGVNEVIDLSKTLQVTLSNE